MILRLDPREVIHVTAIVRKEYEVTFTEISSTEIICFCIFMFHRFCSFVCQLINSWLSEYLEDVHAQISIRSIPSEFGVFPTYTRVARFMYGTMKYIHL